LATARRKMHVYVCIRDLVFKIHPIEGVCYNRKRVFCIERVKTNGVCANVDRASAQHSGYRVICHAGVHEAGVPQEVGR